MFPPTAIGVDLANLPEKIQVITGLISAVVCREHFAAEITPQKGFPQTYKFRTFFVLSLQSAAPDTTCVRDYKHEVLLSDRPAAPTRRFLVPKSLR
ncbi:MAG: hypothetical protein KW788_01705 [Candidatus Doudnabacteria bacterium]|nr:hypothetical protein [Candidatus Doudnabacteria bacterium]